MTLFVSCFRKSKWCGWGFSSRSGLSYYLAKQNNLACMKRPNEGPIKGPFFIDKSLLSDKGLYKCKENLYNVTVLHKRQ